LKKDYATRGLYHEYENISEFRDKVSKAIAMTIIRNFKTVPGISANAASKSNGDSIRPEGIDLLLEMSEDPDGSLLYIEATDGLTLQTNGKQFGAPGNPRSRALYDSLLKQFIVRGLLERPSREQYVLTYSAYEWLDKVKQVRSQAKSAKSAT